MEKWKGKIAVVTGASSGIGARISIDLSESGVMVVALARRHDRLENLSKEHTNIYPVTCDVAKLESIQNAFEYVKENFGKVNILVNNAGRVRDGTILDTIKNTSDYTGTVDVNFNGVIMCTREAFKLMECHNELGFIININSVLGHISPQSKFLQSNVYPATKYALKNFTEMVRLELVYKGLKRIRIANISPGVVKTEIVEAAGHSRELCEKIYRSSIHLQPSCISEAVKHILSQPDNVNITELTIKPTGEKF